MPSPGLRVGVVFGGRSVEHDVSIITGLQACEVLDARHTPVPIYIDRAGRWFTGETLRSVDTYRAPQLDATPVTLDLATGRLRAETAPAEAAGGRGPGLRGRFGGGGPRETSPASELAPLDVIIPATHGTQGEDGCLQGALELADLPYAGPTLESAVLAMNKAVTKAILRSAGVPVLDDLTLRREQYERDGAPAICDRVRARFGLPVYVKPASLGSSVGVTRCPDEAALADALQLAFELDRVALVEPAVEDGKEINCAVLGRPGTEPRVSVCEQPVASAEGYLSFEDKYLRAGGGKGGDKTGAGAGGGKHGGGMSSADRLIPAPISPEQTEAVQDLARRTFAAIGAAGVTRVDLLIDGQERLFVNEPNTIPGSFAFYLFEPAGLPFAELLDALIDLALAEHAERRRTTRTFESNLLAMRGSGAAKRA
jgi:D-alanine-D-alanine ligase